jgi:hypothetical protein
MPLVQPDPQKGQRVPLLSDRAPKDLRAMSLAGVTLLLGTILSSCGFIEPKPATNPTAQPPVVIQYPGIRAQIGDTVNGQMNLQFFPTNDTQQITAVRIYIDTAAVGAVQSPPYKFSINSQLWPNGRHAVSFGVYDPNHNVGLLNLLGAPSFYYGDTVTFLHQPLPPANIVIGQTDGYPLISWTERNPGDASFYIVRRYSGFSFSVDTTFLTKNLSFIDSTATAYIGESVSYDVGASSELGTTYSGLQTHTYGIEPANVANVGHCIAEFENSVVYDAESGQLTKFSCQTGQVMGSTVIPQSPGGLSSTLIAATPSFDNSKIYCWGGTPGQFYALDTNYLPNITVVSTDPSNTPTSRFGVTAGPQNTLFVVLNNGDLHVLDGSNGVLIDSAKGFLTGGTRFVQISPDGHTLLAIDSTNLKRFSVNRSSPTLDGQTSLGGSVGAWAILWSKSEAAICLADPFAGGGNGGVVVWNFENFTEQNINPPPGAEQIGLVAASSNYLYVPYLTRIDGADCTLLVQYDINSLAPTAHWIISAKIQSLVVSKNGVYVLVETSWSTPFLINLSGNSL